MSREKQTAVEQRHALRWAGPCGLSFYQFLCLLAIYKGMFPLPTGDGGRSVDNKISQRLHIKNQNIYFMIYTLTPSLDGIYF